MNIEELKTLAGQIMVDLREDWSENYGGRIRSLIEVLEDISKAGYPEMVSDDIDIAVEELEEQFDGRVFRDCCNLYGYSSNEGLTDEVKERLRFICNGYYG